MKKTRIFLGILGLICLVAMPVSAADNVRNITTYSICREDLYKDQIEDRMGLLIFILLLWNISIMENL